jgi:hypothetical protein
MAAAGQGEAAVAEQAVAIEAAAVQAAADDELQEEMEVASTISRRSASFRGVGNTDRQLAAAAQTLSHWLQENDLPQAFCLHLTVASAATIDDVVARTKKHFNHLTDGQKRDFNEIAMEMTVLVRRKEKADSRDLAEALRIRYQRTETQIAAIRNPRTPRSALQQAIAEATAMVMEDLGRMRRDGESDKLFGGRNTDDLIVAALAEERPETATTEGAGATASAAGMPVRGGPRSFFYFATAQKAVDECCTIAHSQPVIKVTKSAEGPYPWFRAICQGSNDVMTAVTGDNMRQRQMVGGWAVAWDAAAPGETVELDRGGCATELLAESFAVVLTLHYIRTSITDYMPLSGVKYYALCKALLDRTTPDASGMKMPDSAVLTGAHLQEVPPHVKNYVPFNVTLPKAAISAPAATTAPRSYPSGGAYRGRGRGYGEQDRRNSMGTQPSQAPHQSTRGGRGGALPPTRGACYTCGKLGHQARGCPENGKCLHCGATNHATRDCPKPSA